MRSSVIGASVLKPDALAKVCGQAMYAADIRRPGMVYARAVRSPHASAIVKRIDLAPALAHPGVIAAFTAKDIPGTNLVGARGVRDQPVLAEARVNFAGEAVAVVVAESPDAASEAARLAQVAYEPLEPLTDPARALLPDAPHIHPQGNLCAELRIVRGDFQAARKRAALVVTNTFRTQVVDHCALEPDAVVAEPHDGGVWLWESSKSPHNDREELALVLALPREKIRVIVPPVGGSFGGKPDLPALCVAGLAALKLGRPVKIILDRAECFLAKTKRHPYRMEYTHAVAADGTILGAQVDILADVGAYTSYSPTVTAKGLIHALGPYRVPNVEMQMRAAFTNNPVFGAMRGYGVPQVVFAVERQMDVIAAKLGIDPFEFRMKNLLRSGDVTVTGQVMPDVRLADAMLEAKRTMVIASTFASLSVNSAKPPSGRPTRNLGIASSQQPLLAMTPDDAPNVKRAWGMAAFLYGVGRTGLSDKAKVSIRLEADGRAHLFVGTPDTGQGSDTALAQIAAQELGLPFEMVRVTSGDTGVSFDAGTTTASRVTYIVGNAVQRAAAELKKILLDIASEKEGRAVTRLPADAKCLASVAQFCCERNIETTAVGDFGTATSPLDASGQGEPYGAYTFGVQMTLVKVNTDTGKVDVERAVCCYDAGTVVNPALAQAQVEGGTAMAQGYALTEEIGLNAGVPVNLNFHTYLLPTALDVPPMDVSTVASFEPTGPFGAKGVGEPTTLPGAASIVNAVSAALGREFYELPVTPERVISNQYSVFSIQNTGH